MTAMQEQAIEMIKKMPDDKIYYVINILEGIEGLMYSSQAEKITKSQKAYQNFQRFRKCSLAERNYKEELHAALEEKYEGIN